MSYGTSSTASAFNAGAFMGAPIDPHGHGVSGTDHHEKPHGDVDTTTSSETSISIARGTTRQLMFIQSGELLNVAMHSRRQICSLEITHHADGKVSVISRDTPFDCAITCQKWLSRFVPYTVHTILTSNTRKKLRAMDRTGDVWILQFVGTNYRLEIRPGEKLVVTHKVG